MVEKVLGVRVGIGGWRVMGFDTFSLHSNDYELVSISRVSVIEISGFIYTFAGNLQALCQHQVV